MSQGFAGSVTINAGVVDSGNSSTAALNSAAVFTGTWKDVSAYATMVVACKTDQDGKIEIQFSPDGTNEDSTLTRYYRTTQIEPPHRFTITRKYMRVKFTNTSASNQTYLRLQTILGDHADLNIPVDATMSQDYDAVSVRPTEFKYEVALGRRQGATTWNKFGYNGDVDIGTETVWSVGGTHTQLTSASTLTVVSSDANDDGSPAGTGANSIIIYGVDADRKYQTEVVTLNGTGSVVTSASWLGVNRVAVYVCGSNDTNVGNITITATTGGSTQAYIAAGEGTTQQAIFFTQADHTFLADWLTLNVNKVSGGGSPRVTLKGWVKSFVSNAKYEVFRYTLDTTVENHVDIAPTQPFVIGEKSILWFEATTDTNNTTVAMRFSGIEFRDVDA
jgi:hypothetical protein